MSWERDLLLAIHALARPAFDAAFFFSHQLGTIEFGTALVLLVALDHLRRRDRRGAWVWLAVGVCTALLQWKLKDLVGRPRPQLWPWTFEPQGAAWPSGHALSSATFFPLLAWEEARRRPDRAALAWSVAIALVVFVGIGRLYLGVHWPTDVLGGWLMAAAQVAVAVRFLRRPASSPPTSGSAARPDAPSR